MAKSYYILESRKVNGTSERDTTWEVKLTSKNVTESVADLFYDYLAQEMGTLSYFKVSEEIKALRQANRTSRQTALGILAGKVGSFDILIGYVDHATKRLNNDLIADIEQGKDGLSVEEYNQFYAGVKVKPENSHWIYYKAKTFAQESNSELVPYRKPTTVQTSEEVVNPVVVDASDDDTNPTVVVNPNANGDTNPNGVVNPNANGDTNPNGVVINNGNGDGTGDGNGNGNGSGATVVVNPAERQTAQRQDTTPADNQNSARYNPTAGFMRRHVSIITTLTILTTIIALAFTPGTFWATSLLSLLAINFATWAVSFSIMTFVPGLREAKRRDALRSKIDKCSTMSNKHISDYNNNMNVALSQAGVTLCDLQIAVHGEGADKERAMAKVRAALGSCNRDKVLRAIENSKRELQTAINQLYSTNGRGVIVGALRHQEELYDAINARRNAYESKGNTSKVHKYDIMPVALRNYIATYIRCEQAVVEINQKIELLIQCGLEVEKPHFENWDTIKDKTRRYYAGVLNAYYEENHYERGGLPLRINSAGERIKPVETLDEILDDVTDLTGTHVVDPHNSDVVVDVVDEDVLTGTGNPGSGNDGM